MAAMLTNVSYAQDNSSDIFNLNEPIAAINAQFDQMEQEINQSFQTLEQNIKNNSQPSNKEGNYYSEQSFSSSSFSSNMSSNDNHQLSITDSTAFNRYSSKTVKVNQDDMKKIHKEFAGNLLGTNYPWLNKLLIAMEYKALGGEQANPNIKELNQMWQQKYQQADKIDETAILKIKQQLTLSYKDIASFYQSAYEQSGEDETFAKSTFTTLNVNLKTQQPLTLTELLQAGKLEQLKTLVETQFQQDIYAQMEKVVTNETKAALKAKIQQITLPLADNYYLSKKGLHFVYNNSIKKPLNLENKHLLQGISEIVIPWAEIKDMFKPEYFWQA